jgi:hypothetical protein
LWREIPASIKSLLRRCLQKDFSRRYRDADVARIELEDALAFPQQLESPVPAVRGGRRALLLGLTAVGFLALGVIATWILKSSPPSAAQAPVRTKINLPAGDRLDIYRRLTIEGERKQEHFLQSRFNEYFGQFSPDGR